MISPLVPDDSRRVVIAMVEPSVLRSIVEEALRERFQALEGRLTNALQRVAAGVSAQPPAELLSERDVATLLGCAPRTVRRLELRGEIPRSLRIGSAKRWNREEIRQWLDSLQTGKTRSSTIRRS